VTDDGVTLNGWFTPSQSSRDHATVIIFNGNAGNRAFRADLAARLAVEHRPHALILRSPFTSLVDMGRHHYPFLPVARLLRDRFSSLDHIARIGCPLLILAATEDTIVPATQSRRLFAAALEPKRLEMLEHVDHNDYALLAGPEMMAAVTTFLRGLD
jgi:hypothetical protein